MINSKSSELKQIERGHIPPHVYFSEEEHVQMFSGACPRHITKAMLRAMLAVWFVGKSARPAFFFLSPGHYLHFNVYLGYALFAR